MADLPMLCEADLFDEGGYLRLHPGIRTAVANGQFLSGRMHFDRHGRSEGRRANDVDPEFYLRTYPQVTEVFGPLLAGGCAVHYVAYGRGRGYLPRAGAERAAVMPGLWTDAPDALDRIAAQETAGALTDRQAAMLLSWWHDGVIVLDRPTPRDRVEAAALDLERIFAGACPDMLFECPSQPEPMAWQADLVPRPAAAMDPHFLSAPIRSLILDDPVAEFTRLLLQGGPLLVASRGFIRPPVATAERASMRFDCGVPRRFVRAWIALEDDVALTLWKGTHRLPPLTIRVPDGQPALGFRPPQGLGQGQGKHASHGGQRASAWYADRERLDVAITTALQQAGKAASVVRLDRGSVALLHPDLFHACPPLPTLGSARAIAADLCPEMLMPRYGEQAPTPLYRSGSARFASGLYRGIEPLT